MPAFKVVTDHKYSRESARVCGFTFIPVLLFFFSARNSNLTATYDYYFSINVNCDLSISLKRYLKKERTKVYVGHVYSAN